jgi:secondary thiamine-phosphate synthase enzyme
MPSTQSAATSLSTTLLILTILIVSFFPNLFAVLIRLPLRAIAPKVVVVPPPPQIYAPPTMSWFQKSISLPSKSRGSYLVTDHIVNELPEIKGYKVGLLNLFVQHTSCALSLNENWDEDVREDMSDALDRIAPEDKKGNLYRHSAEGLDDMPVSLYCSHARADIQSLTRFLTQAHIKSALIGASITVPITNGKLNTGTWQGIWYLEFRKSKHARKVVATIQGEKL